MSRELSVTLVIQMFCNCPTALHYAYTTANFTFPYVMISPDRSHGRIRSRSSFQFPTHTHQPTDQQNRPELSRCVSVVLVCYLRRTTADNLPRMLGRTKLPGYFPLCLFVEPLKMGTPQPVQLCALALPHRGWAYTDGRFSRLGFSSP